MISSGLRIAGGKLVLSRYSSSIKGGDLINPEARSDNHGRVRPDKPVNILLLGIDARVNNGEPIRADSIIVLHIPKEHDRAYLVSVPRDLIVEIPARSEEHTSELQSHHDLVCRLLLEKKNNTTKQTFFKKKKNKKK